jgi:hypothetical protein
MITHAVLGRELIRLGKGTVSPRAKRGRRLCGTGSPPPAANFPKRNESASGAAADQRASRRFRGLTTTAPPDDDAGMDGPGRYETWRGRARAEDGLAEARDAGHAPPEALLQQIWQAQRVRRDRLRLADGRPLAVLHPGFRNREAGPDFRGAVVQVGEAPPVTGDVEIDRAPAGWRAHAHAVNPAYAGVVLHVVWRAPAAPAERPTLALEPFLDAPWPELAAQGGPGEGEAAPEWLAGRCASPLAGRSPETVRVILREAGLARLRARAAALHARARDAGWEAALWEALFRGLGYKHNAWPMLRLAELRDVVRGHLGPDADALTAEAVWLGVAGLLPAQAPDAGELRRRWDAWWRERDALAPWTLPRTAWRFAGVRPANHPQRRVALAARWWREDRLPAALRGWFLAAPADDAPRAAAALQRLLEPADAGLWGRRFTLASRPAPRPPAWLGAPRATDLAVNAVLPWCRARAGGDAALAARAEALYAAWPAAEDNAVLRLARARLLAGHGARLGRGTAAEQQGLLQIVADFCRRAGALCTDCRFPRLVEQAGA